MASKIFKIGDVVRLTKEALDTFSTRKAPKTKVTNVMPRAGESDLIYLSENLHLYMDKRISASWLELDEAILDISKV